MRYRIIDMAGSELGIVEDDRTEIEMGDTVETPEGNQREVVEIYDDEYGQEGGVMSTLVVDEE